MIISSCPCRVSLGSADHSPFAETFGGVSLSFCITKRVYVIIKKRSILEKYKYRLSYSKTELCNDLEEIQHPLIREALRFAQIIDPLEIIYIADIPAKTGLATSSAFIVALIRALFNYKKMGISNEILFNYAYKIERGLQLGGFQDYAVLYGGINYLEGSFGRLSHKSLGLSPEAHKKFCEHLLLIYTGNQEESQNILKKQLDSLKKGKIIEETRKIKNLVKEMFIIMLNEDFNPLHLCGAMQESWELKKNLSPNMSGETVSYIENEIKIINPNAGLRLVGSGGDRGTVLVLTDPKYKEKIKSKLDQFKIMDIEVDYNGATSRRIYP